jgi:hypothetical protein
VNLEYATCMHARTYATSQKKKNTNNSLRMCISSQLLSLSDIYSFYTYSAYWSNFGVSSKISKICLIYRNISEFEEFRKKQVVMPEIA